jgi:hypothetical protein
MRLTKWIDGRIHKQNDEQEFDLWEIDVIKKLAAYEDAEQQERLVILPCKVGDMVYYKRGGWVCGDTVKIILFDAFGYHVRLDYEHKEFDFEDFGKTVFASREEAEAVLKGESRNGKKPE